MTDEIDETEEEPVAMEATPKAVMRMRGRVVAVTDEIDRLEAMLREATPGPWEHVSEGYVVTPAEEVAACSAGTNDEHEDPTPCDRDARAIAALGSLGLDLVDAVRVLEATSGDARAAATLRNLRARIREVLGEADRG